MSLELMIHLLNFGAMISVPERQTGGVVRWSVAAPPNSFLPPVVAHDIHNSQVMAADFASPGAAFKNIAVKVEGGKGATRTGLTGMRLIHHCMPGKMVH